MSTAIAIPDMASIINKTLFIKVGAYNHVPVYSSITAFFLADLHRPLERQHMMLKAVKALRSRDAGDGCGQKLRVLCGAKGKDWDCLYVVQDDESITIAFPEDF